MRDPFETAFGLPITLQKVLLGGDRLFETINRAQDLAKEAASGWPPFNVKKVDECRYVIEMAVAGFPKHSLDVEMNDGVLTVTGKIDSRDDDKSHYMFKGIAERPFTRRFSLADTVEIKNAELVNGMLRIALENMLPPEKKPRKIDIDSDEHEHDRKHAKKD